MFVSTHVICARLLNSALLKIVFFYFWGEKIQEGKLVVQLEWEPPADCGGAPVASYEAYWAWPFDRQTEKALRNSEFTR